MNAGFAKILWTILTFPMLMFSANAEPKYKAFAGIGVPSPSGQADPGIIAQRIQFKKSSSSATVKGTIQIGSETKRRNRGFFLTEATVGMD